MDENKPRERYEPPTVEDVPLRAEEQVLAGCKGPPHNGAGTPFFCFIGGGKGCQNITAS